ncbi:hypothetical protein [Burkholderia territorii]|uniref:hypothetical protein n=1 Tax=Burkholderia territorii TaxID=1503055 RepID=UPI0012DAA5C8|nr:hypothetical protein [Burkholderia territorii]
MHDNLLLKMRKYTATTQLDADKILSVMKRGGRYTATALSNAAKISISRLPQALNHLIDTRRIVCHVTGQRNQYSLLKADGTPATPELAGGLQTHLTGYDQQMRQFVALCMLTRPPVSTTQSRDAMGGQSAPPNPKGKQLKS